MSFGSPLAEGRLLARHLALLQQEKMQLSAQNAELMRTTRALSERCALLEAACSTGDALDGAEDADMRQLECCKAEERADWSGAAELEAQLADAVARTGDAESRVAASDERAAALSTLLMAAEAQAADTESRHQEVVSALMEARTSLAQLRFEHDEASLAHRRRLADLSSKLERLQCMQAADCARVAALEVQLADSERAKAALARECAARRQASEAMEAPRKPLAEVTNNSAPMGGIRAFAERWHQER